MRTFALTIFLSSFLLFQVQPLIGKYILPWFGGTPAVWTTCLLFFQVILLAGYSYAHLIVARFNPRGQVTLHVTLLVATFLLLPITPSDAWRSTSEGDPTWSILLLLTISIGAPYLLLSATAPLLQSWFNQSYPGRSPFRLYALSNVGSLLALLTFPFLFEPMLRLPTQTGLWSCAYAVFVLACGACGWRLLTRTIHRKASAVADQTSNRDPSLSAGSNTVDSSAGREAPRAADVLFWLGLSACGSVMLMATTNQLCQDVAAVPFLWIVPLSIYLLTFIICFDREAWYRQSLFFTLLVASVFMATLLLFKGSTIHLPVQIAMYSFVLFSCCMSCHGELVKLKPHPRYLTLFYLMVSAGGALGGLFVTLLAPILFTTYLEYHTGLMACCLMMLVVRRRGILRGLSGEQRKKSWYKIAATASVVCVGIGTLGCVLEQYVVPQDDESFASVRNFYGVLRVYHNDAHLPESSRVTMVHGLTIHGYQFQAEDKKCEPTNYYTRESGVGLAIDHHPRRSTASSNLRIGVVGLGAGTLASYATAGDYLRFYEINPAVVELADEYFTYQKDAIARGADVDVFLGDGRIVMERQLERNQSQQFDVLAIDAFSSDAIPVHLLTKECFEVYLRHLKADGILVVHISNVFLDLSPVVRKLAEINGQTSYSVNLRWDNHDDPHGGLVTASHWAVITNNQAFLSSEPVASALKPWPSDAPKPQLWTDDFCNLYSVLR